MSRCRSAQTRSFEGLTDVVFQTGTRNTVRIGARAYYTDFDDPELVDSLSSRGLVSFSRSLSERSTLYARYDFEYSQLGTSFTSHFGSLQWDRVLTRSSSVLLREASATRPRGSRPRSPPRGARTEG